MKASRRVKGFSLVAVVRWAVVVLGAVFVAVGLWLGQQHDVFWKAATLCLECIGIA